MKIPSKEKRLLRHLVNNKRVKLKDVYTLIVSKPTNKIYKQSEWLHYSVFCKDNISTACHIYLNNPYK